MIETAVGGKIVSEMIEGNRRSPILLRYPETARSSPQALSRLLIDTPAGAKVPLAMLADLTEVDGPVQITRESAKRQVVVQSNVEGRDVVGFVDEVRAAIDREVQLAPVTTSPTAGSSRTSSVRPSAWVWWCRSPSRSFS